MNQSAKKGPPTKYPSYDTPVQGLTDIQIVGRDLDYLTRLAGVPRGNDAYDALDRIEKRMTAMEETGQKAIALYLAGERCKKLRIDESDFKTSESEKIQMDLELDKEKQCELELIEVGKRLYALTPTPLDADAKK